MGDNNVVANMKDIFVVVLIYCYFFFYSWIFFFFYKNKNEKWNGRVVWVVGGKPVHLLYQYLLYWFVH